MKRKQICYRYVFLSLCVVFNSSQLLCAQELRNDERASKNQDVLYIRFDENISDIARIIAAISVLDSDKNSLLCALKQHIENGHEVALRDEVLDVLEYADWFVGHYSDNDIQRLIAPQLDRVIE